MAEKKENRPQTIRKIIKNTAKVSSPISSRGDLKPKTLGQPDCPLCHGAGLLRYDVPIDHPQFGKLEVCSCRELELSRANKQRLYALSNLDKLSHLTFDNFLPRGRIGLLPRQADSLERASETCKRFAQSLNGWLLLQGGYGCGKTHLAAATANFVVDIGIPTLFLTVPDLLDSLRFSFDSSEISYEERLNEIKDAQLLILDDFGTQNTTSWAQEKLFQIINHRYINRLPTLITTNLPIRDMEGRIRSRLEDPDQVEQVKIDAPDFRNPTVDMGYHELSSLENKTALNFTTFSLRKGEGLDQDEIRSLEMAYNAARKFSENPTGWLVLMGSYSSGKTHLAAAIANSLERDGKPQLFVSVPEFLDHLRSTFNPNSSIPFDRRFDEVKSAPILILDDLQTQSMSPWVRDKLYQLFIFRFDNQSPTVITTSDSLEMMDSRIQSRILDRRLCTRYAIEVPPYTGNPAKKNISEKAYSNRRKS